MRKKNKRTFPIWAKHLERKFENEKNAKNEAYHFILSRGYYDEFIQFCKQNLGGDQHKACVETIVGQMRKTRNH